MNLNPRTRCPYTLKLLPELEAESDEHVVPDALGGPLSYSVRADRKTNSDFGSTIDAAFAKNLMVAMARYKAGVKSRSGEATLTLTGTTSEGGHPVDVTFNKNLGTQVFYKKPFIPAKDGMGGRLLAGADWEKKSEELKRNYARKGKKLEVAGRESFPTTTVNSQTGISLTEIKVGLMKIAYLAAFEYIGDPFLDDPLNREWQKAIRATDADELENLTIAGGCFAEAELVNGLLPNLDPHQHGIAVFDLQGTGPMAVVRLFGSSVLSLWCKLSNTQDFGLTAAPGKLTVINATDKTVEFSNWKEFLISRSQVD